MAWGLVGAAAVTVVGGYLSSKSGSKSASQGGSGVYDPYSQYRAGDAAQLQELMKNPNSAVDSSYGQALQLGAGRAMAAQGYTGSGNAIIAAANAGGQAYQQQFNNLAMTSGAGQNPAYAGQAADAQSNYKQGQSNQMWGQLGNLAGGVINHYTGSSGSSSDLGTGGYIGGNGTGGYGMQTQTPSSNYGFGYSPQSIGGTF